MTDLEDKFKKGCEEVGGEVESTYKYASCKIDGGEVLLWSGKSFVVSTGFKVNSLVNSPTEIEMERPPSGVTAPTTMAIRNDDGSDISIVGKR